MTDNKTKSTQASFFTQVSFFVVGVFCFVMAIYAAAWMLEEDSINKKINGPKNQQVSKTVEKTDVQKADVEEPSGAVEQKSRKTFVLGITFHVEYDRADSKKELEKSDVIHHSFEFREKTIRNSLKK